MSITSQDSSGHYTIAIVTEPCGTAMVSLVVMQFGTPAMLERPF